MQLYHLQGKLIHEDKNKELKPLYYITHNNNNNNNNNNTHAYEVQILTANILPQISSQNVFTL